MSKTYKPVSPGFALTAVAIIAVITAASPAAAQQQRPPQAPPPSQQTPSAAQLKPYAPIAVTLPKPYADAGFEAFRKQLAAIAAKKDRAALARLVTGDFFWITERGDKANKKKPGIDNLAAAIGLDAEGAPGWELLTEAADETTAEPFPNHKGVMCAPATPVFDAKALQQLVKRTGTTPDDWGYTGKPGVEVHDAGSRHRAGHRAARHVRCARAVRSASPGGEASGILAHPDPGRQSRICRFRCGFAAL